MKIGDFVTIQELKDQDVISWAVLVDLVTDEEGDVEGGIIKAIENTKVKAGNKAASLYKKGIEALVVSGAAKGLSVGQVFVR